MAPRSRVPPLLLAAWAVTGAAPVAAAAGAAPVPAAPAAASPAEPARWRLPVPGGAVIEAYTFDPARPFAAGVRRGVTLGGRSGGVVRAACTGTVAWAGRLPGRAGGKGVTLRCGALLATHLGLASLSARPGGAVRAGAMLGRLGPGGRMGLGARRVGRAAGYLDPMQLIEAAPEPAPPAALPVPRRPPARAPRPATRLRAPARGPSPSRLPAAAPATGAPAVPAVAWAGLALLALGAGAGGGRHRRRRSARRRAAAPPVRTAAEL